MAEGEVWEAEFIKHTIRPQPGQTSNLFHPFLVSPTYICWPDSLFLSHFVSLSLSPSLWTLNFWKLFWSFDTTEPSLFKKTTSDQMWQTLALPNTTHAITHPTLTVPRSAIFCHHSVTYATTAAVSFLSVAMLSVALVELALVEVQTQPTGPDEDQMQPSSVPCSSGASAARRAAVVILKPHSSSILCACAGTNTLAAPDSSQKIAFFFSLVLHSGGHNLYPLSISTPSLLHFRGYVGKKWAVLSLQQQWKISSEFIRGKISILWDHLTLILERITSLTVTPAASSTLFLS